MAEIKKSRPEIKVVGLGGSLAEHSASRAALQIALKGAEEAGARVELFDVRTLNVPMYDPDSHKVPRRPAVWRVQWPKRAARSGAVLSTTGR